MSIECALVGTLVATAERKTSKNGKDYLRFRCAVGGGDDAQYVGVMLFGDCVVDLDGSAVKGRRVYVEGRIRLDKWTDREGAERFGLSVMASYARLAEIGEHKPLRGDHERQQLMPPI